MCKQCCYSLHALVSRGWFWIVSLTPSRRTKKIYRSNIWHFPSSISNACSIADSFRLFFYFVGCAVGNESIHLQRSHHSLYLCIRLCVQITKNQYLCIPCGLEKSQPKEMRFIYLSSNCIAIDYFVHTLSAAKINSVLSIGWWHFTIKWILNPGQILLALTYISYHSGHDGLIWVL